MRDFRIGDRVKYNPKYLPGVPERRGTIVDVNDAYTVQWDDMSVRSAGYLQQHLLLAMDPIDTLIDELGKES